MKIILREAVEHLGEAGDVVTVKPGYARNFLLPRGLAYKATGSNLLRLEAEQKEREERSRRDFLEGKRRASQLEGQALQFEAKAGEEGKLFGSVTSADIADRLNQEGGLDFEVDRRKIELDEPIKQLGEFEVPIRLHAEVRVGVKVTVVAEGG